MTYPNGTSPHTWGTILRTIPLHIPYKYPISPCCVQCVTGRYGCLDATILTKYPPLREDPDGKFPSCLQHLPQVCQVGHTIDKCRTSPPPSMSERLQSSYTIFCGHSVYQNYCQLSYMSLPKTEYELVFTTATTPT